MPKVEAEAKVEAKPIVRAEAKPKPDPKAGVKPKSILKPTRKIEAGFYIRHCTEGSPGRRGLAPLSDRVAYSTMSQYPISEWDMDNLPIDLPDRHKRLAFKRQESKETTELGARPTKVVSLRFFS